ncbi:MAG: Epoxyqueuosine reductase [Alphaproteobacteria bacterium MarineAlpha2_Bin1]|nr:MAG: Epoxyqueuosine reductase [Alphaproteobacteria bacterium MarineAlpha2_Bin1]|tara:strand:- start:456 stop:1568 length:1113 start_codon:yes stop_codon:yes gene_type:complete
MIEDLEQKAISLGFDCFGVAQPSLTKSVSKNLSNFISLKMHGDMQWMENRLSFRNNPKNLWPDVNSVIVLGVNYFYGQSPLSEIGLKNKAFISSYSRGNDYHKVIKKKLKLYTEWIHRRYGGEYKIFVDTAPVMEKPIAVEAGLGWQGKHTNLISKKLGNWFFLGSIFTSLNIKKEKEKVTNHCGSCTSCIDICPTNAIIEPYKLDARRCISYLTIEYKQHIPKEFRKKIGNRIYGCDDCLAICPWNKFARVTNETDFFPRRELNKPSLTKLLKLKDKDFRELFQKSSIKRIGRDRFIRNVLIAIGNSGKKELSHIVEKFILDKSPLVRAMAIWAMSQLIERNYFKYLRGKYVLREENLWVLSEWFKSNE